MGDVGRSQASPCGVGICCNIMHGTTTGEMNQTNQQCEGVDCTNRPAMYDGEMSQTSRSGVGIRSMSDGGICQAGQPGEGICTIKPALSDGEMSQTSQPGEGYMLHHREGY